LCHHRLGRSFGFSLSGKPSCLRVAIANRLDFRKVSPFLKVPFPYSLLKVLQLHSEATPIVNQKELKV